MAIIGSDVQETGDQFSGKVQFDEITRVYTIETDGAEKEDYEVVASAITAGHLPRPGGFYKSTSYQAETLDAVPTDTDRKVWAVTVKFNNRPRDEVSPEEGKNKEFDPEDPELDPLLIKISSAEETRDVLFLDTQSQVASCNLVEEVYSSPAVIHNSNFSIEVTGNTSNPADWVSLVNTVNSEDCKIVATDPITNTGYDLDIPAGKGIIRQFSGDGPKFRNHPTAIDIQGNPLKVYYYSNTISIEVRDMPMDFSLMQLIELDYSSTTQQVTSDVIDSGHAKWKYFSDNHAPWVELKPHTARRRFRSTADQLSVWAVSTDYNGGDVVKQSDDGGTTWYISTCTEPHTSTNNNKPGTSEGSLYWQYQFLSVANASMTNLNIYEAILKSHMGSVRPEDDGPVDEAEPIDASGRLWRSRYESTATANERPLPVHVIWPYELVDWRTYSFAEAM